jgi:ketosteroid isomerase-like protein
MGRMPRHTAIVADVVDRLLELWTRPLPDDPEAAAGAVRELYADPCIVNGVELRSADFVERIRALHSTLADIEREVLDLVVGDDRVAVAFRLRGRHVGAYASQLGPVPATGGTLEMRVIDTLHLVDGRIAEIVMVGDELAALRGLGVVALVG